MTTEMVVPWTQKYRPKTLSQVVGNEKAVSTILDWLTKWSPSGEKVEKRQKAVLLYGAPGTGKTVVVEAIANDYDYILVETNASDFRTASQIERRISRSIGYHYFDETLRAKRRIILFDEVDGISGRGDRGGVGEIINVIKQTTCPVFLTANDIYDPKLRTLRSYCLGVNFQQLAEGDIARRLAAICTSEGIEAEVDALRYIAQNANGDLRAAINDLQALTKGVSTLRMEDVGVYARNTRLQTFDALRKFFSAKTRAEARRAIESATINYEIMMQCIHESLPYQFKDVRDLAVAYDVLSNASLFLKRAQRERAWQLLRYFFDLMTEIPLVRKYGQSSNYVRFSQKLVEMSRSRSRRALLKEVGTRIGRKCHISSSMAIKEVVPYLKVIYSANPTAAAELHEWFELDEKMSECLRVHGADR